MKQFFGVFFGLAFGVLVGWNGSALYAVHQAAVASRASQAKNIAAELDTAETNIKAVSKMLERDQKFPVVAFGISYGVGFVNTTDADNQHVGVVILDVFRDSPAAKAKVLPGDQIRKVGGYTITDLAPAEYKDLDIGGIREYLKPDMEQAALAFLHGDDGVEVAVFRPKTGERFAVKFSRKAVVGKALGEYANDPLQRDAWQEILTSQTAEVVAIRSDLDKAQQAGDDAALYQCDHRAAEVGNQIILGPAVKEYLDFRNAQFIYSPDEK